MIDVPIVAVVNCEQFSKALSPIGDFAFEIINVFNDLHDSNACEPMFVTVDGIDIVVIPVDWNALFPIVLILVPKLTEVANEQLLKALSPIVVSAFEMLNVFNAVHDSNELTPILVTIDGIVIVVTLVDWNA